MAKFTLMVSCLSNHKLMSANADQADDDAWSAMYVYLLHFNKPINPNRPTQHYLGFAKDLDERIREHRKGKGARLTQVALTREISFKVAEVWRGDRSLEKQLKRQKNHRRFCPICNNR